ncbi:MAG: hypothetical protein FWG68_09700 [Defluviitaleaceae bacterium]|nr:hypothetical protein [Defluviitaleaceae bacterium]
MNCKKCGNQLSATAVFCGSCGSPTGQRQGQQKKSPIKFIVAGISATAIVAIIAAVVLFSPLGEIGETGFFAQLLAQFGDNGDNSENYTETGESPENGENGQNTTTLQDDTIHTISLELSATPLNDEIMEHLRQFPNLDLRLTWSTSQESLSNDVPLLASLANLTALTLRLDNEVTDISPLASFTNLTELRLTKWGTQTTDITPLANLTNLTTLTLDLHSGVTDITPLANLTNLAMLELRLGSGVINITALENLTNLTILEFSLANSQVADITQLANLRNLAELTLSSNLNNITPFVSQLANLTNLEVLELRLGVSNQESLENNILLLASLANLTALTLTFDSQVNDITPLESLTNLTSLGLITGGGTQISDITPLASLTNLTALELRLQHAQTTDITPLASLTNLTALELRLGREITDITPLANLANLTELSLILDSPQVTDIIPLASLANLTELDLRLWNSPEVADITPLANLANLTELYLELRHGEVSDIIPLANFTNLTELRLELWGPPVTDITPLANLANLTTLSLSAIWGTQISDITPLASLTNLTALSLEFRDGEEQRLAITDITPLARLTNLTAPTLFVIPVPDWSPVAHIPIVRGRPADWAETEQPTETAEVARSAAPTALETQFPGLTAGMAAAYLSALEGVIAEYGIFQEDFSWWDETHTGLGYSLLIDFEGNGSPYLVVNFAGWVDDNRERALPIMAIYSYSNGFVQRVFEENPDHRIGSTLVTATSGYYLMRSGWGSGVNSALTGTFYTFANSERVHVISLVNDTDESDFPNFTPRWSINGVQVSEEEHNAAWAELGIIHMESSHGFIEKNPIALQNFMDDLRNIAGETPPTAPIAAAPTAAANLSQTVPHPFVFAMQEYFAGCAADVAEGTRARRAFLVDVDGNGTLGMLVVRTLFGWGETRSAEAMLFAMVDGRMVSLDLGRQGDGNPIIGATVAGNRAVRLGADGGVVSHTLFTTENGQIISDFTISRNWYFDVTNDESYIFYYIPNISNDPLFNWNNRQTITEEEYNTMLANYGLNNTQRLSVWYSGASGTDDSEQILAMTMPATVNAAHITTANLHLRAAPSTDAPSLALVPTNSEILVIERAAANSVWFRVQGNSEQDFQFGYMHSDFLIPLQA